MKTTYYRVAGHTFAFRTPDGDNQDYLPSYAPFICKHQEGEPLLFTLTLDDTFYPAERGATIGQFDSGGADFGVYRLKDGSYQFLINPPGRPYCGLLQTSPTLSEGIAALRGDESTRAYAANNCMMILYAFAAADKRTMMFHASVIGHNGKGFLFLGKSGTGKSTHSQQWLRYIDGSELINDDNPVVTVSSEGKAIVWGSPWSGKTPCYRNVEAPVGAFVRIRQEKENHITRNDTIQAFASLLPSVSTMKWDDRVYNSICDSIALLISSIPCYTLGCRPDKEAAEVCRACVEGEENGTPSIKNPETEA